MIIAVDLPGEQEAAIVSQGAAPPLSILAKDGGTGLVSLKLGGGINDAALHLTNVTAGLPGGINAATLSQIDLRAAFPANPASRPYRDRRYDSPGSTPQGPRLATRHRNRPWAAP